MSGARPIRVLVAKPGLDGHDVGARIVCRALRDAGMEVIYTGLRQSPEAIARAALEEAVDVVGLSILSGAHLPLTRKVADRLRAEKLDVVLVVGGCIPERDREALAAAGADLIMPSGTPLAELAGRIAAQVRR